MPLMKNPRHTSEQARENEAMVLIWNIFRPVECWGRLFIP